MYAATVLLLPRVDVPLGDDWAYARSVETLLEEGRLRIIDASVVTLVFQVFWGALFASVLGLSYVSLRLSTAVLSAAGAVALFALCRALGVSRRWSAVAAAAWLFNPLAYALSNSFMTDASFAALLVVASTFYLRGLHPREGSTFLVVAGSAAAAVAFLVRQQGLLIPLSVLLFLLAAKRIPFGRRAVPVLVPVAAVPAATAVLYWLWIGLVHGVPSGQRMFTEELSLLWRSGTPRFLGELLTAQVMYAGLFVLPVSVAALAGTVSLVRSFPRRAWWILAPVTVVVVVGGGLLAAEERLMPYVPQFLAPWGLGPADVQGGRPELVGRVALVWLTLVVAVSAVVGAAFLARRLVAPAEEGASGARLVTTILLVQAAGVLPAALHFQNPVPGGIITPTLDRYLLPTLPLVLCLAVWALAGMRLPSWPAWVVVAGLAVVAVAGTRDYLVFQGRVWDVASAANAAGVDNDRLDGGAQWGAEHLYQSGVERPPDRHDRPWWINLFAWTTDASWVVATEPLPGYVEAWAVTYDTWLPPGSERPLLLLRREDVPPPP